MTSSARPSDTGRRPLPAGRAGLHPDFGRLAPLYDQLRPADDNWWELFELLVREGDLRGRRVLDAGGGTGLLAAALAERALCRVWLVDPSAEMLEQARARVPPGVGLKQGRAEELPFKDGWFERAVARCSVHLWERPCAFAEVRRAAERFVVATFDPVHFADFWLNRYFPSMGEIDRARFPDGPALERELRDAGFLEVRLVRLTQQREVLREEALARIEGRHISTFDLLDEDELREGTERARRELPDRVESRLEWLVAVAA
jgi:ubiquinone/menaquinone biosynthesis C-methylase UbiE